MKIKSNYDKVKIEVHEFYAEHEGFTDHAIAIGYLIYDWNNLHATLLAIFARFLGEIYPLEMSKAIWHSIRSDANQRDVFRSAAKVALKKEPDVLGEFLWALDQVDHLSGGRNDSVHMNISVSANPKEGPGIVSPDSVFGHPRYDRLSDIDLPLYYKAIRRYTQELDQFIGRISYLMYDDEESPWPERPQYSDIIKNRFSQQNNTTKVNEKKQEMKCNF